MEFRDDLAPFRPIAGEELRGGAGRGRAQVRHEVSNGEIGLVADGGNGGHGARGQGAGDGFLVEGPQVLEASSAARDDEEVDVVFPR